MTSISVFQRHPHTSRAHKMNSTDSQQICDFPLWFASTQSSFRLLPGKLFSGSSQSKGHHITFAPSRKQQNQHPYHFNSSSTAK